MNEGAALGLVLDQVGKDKNIDKSVLINALEQAILTAAKRTFGMNREMEAKFNEETGSVDLFLIVNVVDERRRDRGPRDHRRAGAHAPASRPSSATSCCSRSSTAPRTQTQRRGAGREVRRPARAQERAQEASAASPRRPPSRSSPARPRGRARQRLQRVQGPQGRDHHRHRAPLRARQHSSSTSAAPRPCCRCASRCRARRYRAGDRIVAYVLDIDRRRARPADHPVAHAQGPAREAVRDGGPRDLREDRAHRGVGARAGRAREDRRVARATATSIRSARASA